MQQPGAFTIQQLCLSLNPGSELSCGLVLAAHILCAAGKVAGATVGWALHLFGSQSLAARPRLQQRSWEV